MIQEQGSSTNQGGRGCEGGVQRERAVTPFVESSLDWKSTRFEMLSECPRASHLNLPRFQEKCMA